MKNGLKQLTRHIFQFGLFKGIIIYCKNHYSKKGISRCSLKKVSHPIFLRRGSSDVETFNQVFINGEYKFDPGFTPAFIIDCGANIGLSAVYFKSVFPNAFIVAVEPEKSNFEMLVKNTKKYEDIDCIQSGIWYKNAILKVEASNNPSSKWGFMCKEVDKENGNTVKAISIQEIMRQYNRQQIDLLKIDIEGSELELFSRDYEKWLPYTKAIVIELHDFTRKGCSKAFFNAFTKYDFSMYIVGENILGIRN